MPVVCVLSNVPKNKLGMIFNFFCLPNRQTISTSFLTPLCACAIGTRFRTICQILSQSTAKLEVCVVICAPIRVIQCSKYKIRLKLSRSSIIDWQLLKDRQREPIAQPCSTLGELTFSVLVTKVQLSKDPFLSSSCQGWSFPRKCSGLSPIPDLHQWLLWFRKILFICVLITPPSAVTSLLLQTDGLQLHPSLQILKESRAGYHINLY